MKPSVTILSCGGTIASTGGEEGAAPSKSGDDLVAAVPGLDEHAEIDVREVAHLPGFDMTFEAVANLVAAVREGDADAYVVTHGTDTMEESAYALDLLLDGPPVVFTGAQRAADAVSADGPGNLLDAVRFAANESVREAGGVYLSFASELHAARDVTKTHTHELETFASPGKGPVAELAPDGIRYHREPGSRSASLLGADPTADLDVRVAKSALGVDGRPVERAVCDGADGVVVEGTGLGNVTGALGDAIAEAIDAGIPVVLTSRCHAGPVAPVYGTAGGAETLRRHGALFGDDLPAHKARIKLLLALDAVESTDDLGAFFD